MTNMVNKPTYTPCPNPAPFNSAQGSTAKTVTPFQSLTPQHSGAAQTYGVPTPAQASMGSGAFAGTPAHQAPAFQANTRQAQPSQIQAPVAPITVQQHSSSNPSQQGVTYPNQIQPQVYPQTQTMTPVQRGQGSINGQELTDRDHEFEKEDKKLYHKRTRIVKFATNKTYFEVFNFGFKHGRVAIKMSNYKPQYSEILISLKLGEYFELKDLIMTGAIHHRQPDKYHNLHFYNKGTASKYSKDGSVSARQLGIQCANDPSKYVVTFVAKEGPGKQDHKGLIQFVGKPNTTVIYPMTRAMLVELFSTVDLHLQGYLNACYQYQFQNIPSFTKES